MFTDSSDEFVIVIPPCFDPNAPLTAAGQTQQNAVEDKTNDRNNTICGEDSIGGLPDWEVLSSPDGPPQPIPQLGPNPDNTSPRVSPNATPKQARRVANNFKFHRKTLGEATIKEPLTIATGLVNTFTNFVKDIHVHHCPQDSPAGDIRLEPVDNNQNICGQNDLNTPFEGGSDEDFQVRMFVCMYILICCCVCYSTCLCVSASLYVLQMLYSSILFVRRMPVKIWLTKIYLTQLKSFRRLETPTNILQSWNKSLQ